MEGESDAGWAGIYGRCGIGIYLGYFFMFKVEFEGLEVESDVPVCWLGMGSGGC